MAYALHQLLTRSAQRRPDAEAVRLLDQALTYGELEARSNRIAHALIAHGVKPGDRVGIYLQKSPNAIASIFGIMKTGACYVPVDANAPGPRLLEIGRQCNFRALVTSEALYKKLEPDFSGYQKEHPMGALFFVDQAPAGSLPLPSMGYGDGLAAHSAEEP